METLFKGEYREIRTTGTMENNKEKQRRNTGMKPVHWGQEKQKKKPDWRRIVIFKRRR